MKNILLTACAAIALAMGAAAASADDGRYNDNGGYSWQYQYPYSGTYGDNGSYSGQYQYPYSGTYGDNTRQRYWNDGRYPYRHDAVTPRTIVRNLERNDYRNISQPLLSGRFYQVKAISPRGHKVKLYIDRYSGEIAKIKS